MVPCSGDRFTTTSGTAITPQTTGGVVVWNDGEAVHYRLDTRPHRVEQTPVQRFVELAHITGQPSCV